MERKKTRFHESQISLSTLRNFGHFEKIDNVIALFIVANIKKDVCLLKKTMLKRTCAKAISIK